MKKFLILLFLSLLTLTAHSSDTISVDSLKVVALIFNDHARLEKENGLLKSEIKSLKDLNEVYVQSDSLKSYEIDLYKEKSKDDERTIKRLKKSRKTISIGAGIGGVLLLILGIFIGK